MIKTINVGLAFSEFLTGRKRIDNRFSGEAFLYDVLLPALRTSDQLILELDSVRGFSSAFMEEVFGGLIRLQEFTKEELDQKLVIKTMMKSWIREINQYLERV